MVKRKHSKRTEAIFLLNREGWNDTEIADAFGSNSRAIWALRKRNGVPAVGTKYGAKIDQAEAVRLHGAGWSDGRIARHFGADQSAVTKWRKRKGLPPNFLGVRHLSDETRKGVRKLLSHGATRAKVQERFGVAKKTSTTIRAKMKPEGLRKTGITDRALRARLRKLDRLLERLENAIGANTPAHIREHAVYDMYGDLFECVLSIDDIERRAPSYRAAAYEMCGDEWSHTRLDRVDDEGLSAMDLLADPASNNGSYW